MTVFHCMEEAQALTGAFANCPFQLCCAHSLEGIVEC